MWQKEVTDSKQRNDKHWERNREVIFLYSSPITLKWEFLYVSNPFASWSDQWPLTRICSSTGKWRSQDVVCGWEKICATRRLRLVQIVKGCCLNSLISDRVQRYNSYPALGCVFIPLFSLEVPKARLYQAGALRGSTEVLALHFNDKLSSPKNSTTCLFGRNKRILGLSFQTWPCHWSSAVEKGQPTPPSASTGALVRVWSQAGCSERP